MPARATAKGSQSAPSSNVMLEGNRWSHCCGCTCQRFSRPWKGGVEKKTMSGPASDALSDGIQVATRHPTHIRCTVRFGKHRIRVYCKEDQLRGTRDRLLSIESRLGLQRRLRRRFRVQHRLHYGRPSSVQLRHVSCSGMASKPRPRLFAHERRLRHPPKVTIGSADSCRSNVDKDLVLAGLWLR